MNTFLPLLLCLLLSPCHGKHTSEAPPCPEPLDIYPCVCDADTLTINCSNVTDEDQLRQVFTAPFPTAALHEFLMDGNKGVRVLENGVFGDVSFRVLTVMHSVLEAVRDEALVSSYPTLTHVILASSPLAVFPFHALQRFTALEMVIMVQCDVHSLPSLSSASLQELYLYSNPISSLSLDVFALLSAVRTIDLSDNQLTEITQGK